MESLKKYYPSFWSFIIIVSLKKRLYVLSKRMKWSISNTKLRTMHDAQPFCLSITPLSALTPHPSGKAYTYNGLPTTGLTDL